MTIELPQLHPKLGQPSKVYPYRDMEGETLAAVYRFESGCGKTIRPFDCETGQWAFPENRSLYGLDYLKDISLRNTVANSCDETPNSNLKESSLRNTVILVEGEKSADALLKKGFLSTTSMGGSNAAHKTDWSPLQNLKVIIWPDNDEPGLKYAEAAAEELLKAGACVYLIDIHNATLRNVAEEPLRISIGNVLCNDTYTNGPIGDVCPKGWDAADAVEAGFSTRDIETLLEQAEPYRADVPSRTPIGNAAPANDNWPEPDMSFLKDEIAPPEFPLEIFPPEIAAWVSQTAESKSAPVDYVAGALLTVSASLIGSSRKISPWQGWSETPVLWCALVGSPSSGKSPAMDPVLSVMRDLEALYVEDHAAQMLEYETDKLEAELVKGKWQSHAKDAHSKQQAPPLMPEKAKAPEEPQRKRLILRDATSEAIAMALRSQPKGILTYRDELAGWFASFDRYSAGKGGDRAFWLEAFGARPYTVDRIKNGGEPIVIPHLASSILGGIQPERLESCLMKGNDDGLSARFIYFYPNQVRRNRPRHIPDDAVIKRTLKCLANLQFDIADGKEMPRTLTLSSAAVDVFEAWWKSLPDKEPKGRLGGWWGKLQGNVLRIALVLQYLGQSDGKQTEPYEISEAVTRTAIQFADAYLMPMAERAHGLSQQSKAHQNTVIFAEHIMAAKMTEFTVRDLVRSAPMRVIGTEGTKEAVNELVGSDWLRAAPVRQGDTPGKAQARYIVNPCL